MSGDPYSTYYEPPAAELGPAHRLEPPHSGLGIASFFIGLFAGIGELALIGVLGYIQATRPGTITPESPEAIVLGLLMFAGLAVAFLGAGLGLGGLFQGNRKRVFAVLGLVFNTMILMSFLGLMVVGMVVKG